MAHSIKIRVYKHDDLVTRIFTHELYLGEWADAHVCYAKQGMPVHEMKKENWSLHYNHFFVLPKNAHYNFMVLEKENGLEYYCNLAAPPVLTDDAIHYIDYDIDIIRTPDGTITVHDVDEFAERRVAYGYSAELVEHLLDVQAKIEKSLAQDDDYFGTKFYAMLKSMTG